MADFHYEQRTSQVLQEQGGLIAPVGLTTLLLVRKRGTDESDSTAIKLTSEAALLRAYSRKAISPSSFRPMDRAHN